MRLVLWWFDRQEYRLTKFLLKRSICWASDWLVRTVKWTRKTGNQFWTQRAGPAGPVTFLLVFSAGLFFSVVGEEPAAGQLEGLQVLFVVSSDLVLS